MYIPEKIKKWADSKIIISISKSMAAKNLQKSPSLAKIMW